MYLYKICIAIGQKNNFFRFDFDVVTRFIVRRVELVLIVPYQERASERGNIVGEGEDHFLMENHVAYKVDELQFIT